MGTYKVGPVGGTGLHLTGHDTAAKPGETVEHDFSPDGPDGVHGPSREQALLGAGALQPAPEPRSLRRPPAAVTTEE